MIELQAIITGTGDTITNAYRDAETQIDALNEDGQQVVSSTKAPAYKDMNGEWAITFTVTLQIPEQ